MEAHAVAALLQTESVKEEKGRIPYYLPILLGLPALYPLVHSCLSAWLQGRVPTGFIQYDMAYYIANAREHFDQGFQLTYGNPYGAYGTPCIYFQPQILLLALIHKAGLSPGLCLNLFGLGSLVLATTAAGRLYQELVGWQTRAQKVAFICFFWGGGLLSIVGIAAGMQQGLDPIAASLLLDPSQGWWMLNFGRNLVSPMEAYYHGVFLLAILMLIQQRFGLTLALTTLLVLSHPFTGLSLALIILAYSGLEVMIGSGAVSRGMLTGAGTIFAFHILYYIYFLNQFEDHRIVREQWQIYWPYLPWTFLPALALVGFWALSNRNLRTTLKLVPKSPRVRLLIIWSAVILGLTQHNLVMKPIQPIHFAHGYDWIAMFFLGSAGMVALLNRLLSVRIWVARMTSVAVFLTIMLSDNLLWFVSFSDKTVQDNAISLTFEQQDVLKWLNRNAQPPALVASDDPIINYLTSTYTSVRSWWGHGYNTPNAKVKAQEVYDAFNSGRFLVTANPIYYITEEARNWIPPGGAKREYSNGRYIVWSSNYERRAARMQSVTGN